MEFFETLQKRYSYRDAYTEASIPREDLQKIAEAGTLAPSGCNAQTTDIVVVDDPALLAEMAKLIARPASMATAKAAFLLISSPKEVFAGRSFHVEDFSAMAQNMLLAITALGYASVWVQGTLLVNSAAEKIAEMIHLPEGKTVHILLPVGIAEKEGSRPVKKAPEERIRWNQY